MKSLFKYIMLGAIVFLSRQAQATQNPLPVTLTPSVTISSVPVNAGASALVTIATATSSGAYSAGYSNYITHMYIVAYPTATVAGAAAPVSCTTTGLPNNLTITIATGITVGVPVINDFKFEESPIQGTPGTKFTLTCPAATATLWNVFVNYFQAP